MDELRKKLLITYIFFNYNFFKLKKLIEMNVSLNQSSLIEFLDFIIKSLNIQEKELLDKYQLDFEYLKYKTKFFLDQDFPKILYENDCGILFYRGNWQFLEDSFYRVSIVGSRKPLEVSSNFVSSLFKQLRFIDSKDKLVIVSGLALGIDSIALKNAIANGIKAISVLGNGMDYYYPYQNRALQDQISKKGLIFSEYLPNQKPKKYFFPYRNRLISSISSVVIVVQAAKNSGSLVTGKYALENGKTLLVPFLSNSPEFEGSKELINSGAILITKPEEVIQYLGFDPNKIKLECYPENKYDNVVEIIKNNPGITIEKISELLKMDFSETLKIVTELEIEGKVTVNFNYTVFLN